MATSCRAVSSSTIVLALLVPLFALVAPSASATPQTSAPTTVALKAESPGRVRGQVVDNRGRGAAKIQVIWFAADGRYLGKRKANRNGIYSVGPLPPGTYLFQFVDRRAAWNTERFAQRDVRVRVKSNRTTQKRIKMRRGASITGVITAKGKRVKKPTVVAANQYGTSFEVRANKRGEFALGGLPAANYSVFVWDRTARWAGKSTWVPKLKRGKSKHVNIRLNKRAGGLSVDLYPLADYRRAKVWVTLTNRRTGQWYVVRARNGTVNAAGLMPGRYRISVPGAGNRIGASGKVGKVRAGKVTFSSFRLKKRGGWITATVVDSMQTDTPLAGVVVRAYDRYGTAIGKATSDSAGRVRLGGSYTRMDGISLVLERTANGGWIECPSGETIRYERTEHREVSVRVGRETAVGSIALPRHTNTDNMEKSCRPKPRDGEPEPGDGQPEPGDGEPVPDDGQPEPGDGEPVPGEGQPEPSVN